MNSDDFVRSLIDTVRNPTIEDSLKNFVSPPGRNPPIKLKSISLFFKNLSVDEKEIVKDIVEEAVDLSLFRVLFLIDGTRKIHNDVDYFGIYLSKNKKSNPIQKKMRTIFMKLTTNIMGTDQYL